MPWIAWVFASVVAGSICGIFWPAVVKQFRDSTPVAVAFSDPRSKIIRYLVFGVIIAVVVSALGFAAFVGTPAEQEALRALGSLAYFTAFTFGFSTASMIEEPLKKA